MPLLEELLRRFIKEFHSESAFSNPPPQHLPDNMGRLLNLTRLNCRGNKLVTLPPSLCYCTHINDLVLNENKLVSLPPGKYLGRLFALLKIYKFTYNIEYLVVLTAAKNCSKFAN